MRLRTVGIGFALAGVMAGFGGCRASHSHSALTSPAYISLYRSGQYAEAFEAAKGVPTSASGRERLIAGMALEALDRDAEARQWLEPISRSADRQIRGRANATLGLILAKEGKHAEAAALLDRATADLSGPMKGWAAWYGAREYDEIGDSRGARRLSALSQLRGGLSVTVPHPGDFTLQLGSFTSRSRAQSRARATIQAARSAGLETPRVELTVAGGRTLYAVRVGPFATKGAAMAASGRFPGDSVVIRNH